ncbi:DEKNAAC101442 [Brettanomyces naardenensis]|uniref:6,7-dimethyl-8-ribityllumazine synthase n=1 Tax=Brettanomyces naardenensis TaxID=13370 RepID=A0A448YIB2_BRENA|nr:DEKNAAC101442 [Brettanomyces naardenensis]
MAASGRAKQDQQLDGSKLKIAIVHARWNEEIIDALVDGCVKRLLSVGVKKENIVIETVPGSYELPVGAAALASDVSIDAVIAVGCLIKGSTMHFEYISEAVSNKIMDIQFKVGKPIIFGLLTCLTLEQAKARAGLIPGVMHNHGVDWADCAVEMASKYGADFRTATWK